MNRPELPAGIHKFSWENGRQAGLKLSLRYPDLPGVKEGGGYPFIGRGCGGIRRGDL